MKPKAKAKSGSKQIIKERTDSVKPFEPVIEPIEPVQPVKPVEPVEPIKTVEPVKVKGKGQSQCPNCKTIMLNQN